MLEIERFEKILLELEKRGRLSYQELDELIDVSNSTIRRDVEKMYSNGLLTKIKGGVAQIKRLNFDLDVMDRFNENISEKKKIAEKAAKIIKKGDFIYLDAGTTIFYVIEKLKDLDVTVVTNGLMHLEELMKYKIKTVVLGGEIKGQTGAIVGVEAINFISKYRFDKCFLGTNGISLDTGFTTPEVNEAYLKKKAIELSEESFVLADKRKFNRVSNINFSSFKECKIITSKEAIKENNRYKKYFY
ncbi:MULTISPECIES: DeoR/GlpR family DNA-binding transcription regulator [unclassified Leptotrichia]|jgi:uncharacterized HTH-type transcriptional regulator fruR|uniref:DeoR/GlpR family DNA-binding transcription regulator n=1 Tax=unclassified Leptotrichia TaxID=2633022 RepID=UPI001798A8AC|nr:MULTISPECIES: DeoR/GlpR family DNA-binding transcription regulator [unclassified Leptotrichia]MBB1534163.1 DeoR/GlpR transcriptional regulator [Leptotrichia sp.]QUB97748.1 DeoR/GlpR transcriptional regulator [Leptotrichia sp. oral taxon 221]